MHRLSRDSEDTTLFPWSKGRPWPGAVAVMAAGTALLAGWLTDHKSAVFVIVASYFAQGPHYAAGCSLMVLAGGGLQIAVFSVFYLLRPEPHEPGASSA